ncbi:MAG TPA: FAD-binding protein, partial [Thermoanaerobaculia bacterium]|nr:FAD-binding protein [Thermoanaerobaculia bacterium]
VIAGAGLAGLVAAHELLDHGKSVLLLDKDVPENLGGLAKESFGGVHLIGTPHQKKSGIADSPELALHDWLSFARFGEGDSWPRRWAELYCDRSLDLIHAYLDGVGVKFLPVVNWPERGLYTPGNTVPRWHIAWGTGHAIIEQVVRALATHPRTAAHTIRFRHAVEDVEVAGSRVSGLFGTDLSTGGRFVARGDQVVIATGGICGGDLSKVRANWYAPWGAPPKVLLNGAHVYGDGEMHDAVARAGGNLTHLDKQWHYAAGVHHPAKRKPNDGLSLVPPRSALWLNALGERIGPVPLVGSTDTRFLVESVLGQPGQYSWQLLNNTIAKKELAVSGCDYMTAFRHKKKLLMARQLLFGNQELVDRLARECPDDIVTARSLAELVDLMNARNLDGLRTDLATVEQVVRDYDAQIDRGPAYFNDDQLRRLWNFRQYRGDRIRLCKFQKILDPTAMPLIAIREFILSRKSLGGIQTDLGCRVLRADGVEAVDRRGVRVTGTVKIGARKSGAWLVRHALEQL